MSKKKNSTINFDIHCRFFFSFCFSSTHTYKIKWKTFPIFDMNKEIESYLYKFVVYVNLCVSVFKTKSKKKLSEKMLLVQKERKKKKQ